MTLGTPERRRLLFVPAQEPWPLSNGATLRVYNFLKRMAPVLDITLAVPHRPRYREELPAGIRVVTIPAEATPSETQKNASVVIRRVQRHFGTSPGVWRWLEAEATPENYDAVLLDGTLMGQYVDAVQVPAVWYPADDLMLYTCRDVAWRRLRRWPALIRRAVLYAAYQRYVSQRVASTIFVSPVDVQYAQRLCGVQNGVSISMGWTSSIFGARTTRPSGAR
jgi:hypothetical protein